LIVELTSVFAVNVPTDAFPLASRFTIAFAKLLLVAASRVDLSSALSVPGVKSVAGGIIRCAIPTSPPMIPKQKRRRP
jgi:hypothetical protein